MPLGSKYQSQNTPLLRSLTITSNSCPKVISWFPLLNQLIANCPCRGHHFLRPFNPSRLPLGSWTLASPSFSTLHHSPRVLFFLRCIFQISDLLFSFCSHTWSSIPPLEQGCGFLPDRLLQTAPTPSLPFPHPTPLQATL